MAQQRLGDKPSYDSIHDESDIITYNNIQQYHEFYISNTWVRKWLEVRSPEVGQSSSGGNQPFQLW